MQKAKAALAAVFLLFTMTSISVSAQANTLSPPQLYSEAAVLMDADTGQVLWGKNMNKRMFPASLTKVVTCLIAMEKGNPEDIVTMTDEGVFSVPRSTTHAALTPGEQLTFEQLEYAMMVESANDAANGIAIHIAGSLEGFADLMNQKAAEIGARGTHFTNASGLPDNNHYTTAYDLGLFTKEALKYPEFRTLAGTKYYEIPPTNRQKDTRRFSNRQYMFCLNNTYKGAFAGKTGWTEEAGKTLITVAERNGITLIAVVLKASGTVDAEFKDSTALLDYGYDHFKRVTLPSESLPIQEIPYGNTDGTMSTAKLKVQQGIGVLLPEQVMPQDLQIAVDANDPENAMMTVTAPDYAQKWMGSFMGSYPMTLNLPEVPVAASISWLDELLQRIEPIVHSTLKWFIIILAALVIVILLLRQILRARYRKRRKARMRNRNIIDGTMRSSEHSRVEPYQRKIK